MWKNSTDIHELKRDKSVDNLSELLKDDESSDAK